MTDDTLSAAIAISKACEALEEARCEQERAAYRHAHLRHDVAASAQALLTANERLNAALTEVHRLMGGAK
jgi:hypothetical protein